MDRLLFLGAIHNGRAEFRREPMEKAYAAIDEESVAYAGPPIADGPAGEMVVAIFGPGADKLAADSLVRSAAGDRFRLLGIAANGEWGKPSAALVAAMGDPRLAGIIASDRASSHLAEQLAAKLFIPLIAISGDRSLTSLNIPWVFRLPPEISVEQAVRVMAEAAEKAGPNRGRLREVLASGAEFAGVKFAPRGEPR